VCVNTGAWGCCGANVIMSLWYKCGSDSRLQDVRPPHPHLPMHDPHALRRCPVHRACGSVEKEACVIWVGVHADTGSGGCCGARVMMWLWYEHGWDSRMQDVRPPHPHPPMHDPHVLRRCSVHRACGSVEKEACVIWVGVHADTSSGGCCGARVMIWLCFEHVWESRLQGVRPLIHILSYTICMHSFVALCIGRAEAWRKRRV
jgi:hypothetical protein